MRAGPFSRLLPLLLVLLLAVAGSGSARAAPAAPRPSLGCRFLGKALILKLRVPWSVAVSARWSGINVSGQRVGGERTWSGEVKKGPNEITLAAEPALDYRVQVHLAGTTLARICQRDRGEWAAGPESLKPTFSRRPFEAAESLVVEGDLKLGEGFAATAGENPQGARLVVERTFGARAEHGIRPPRGAGLAVVARGNVGPIRVSAAQRLGRGNLNYWDYYLVLSPAFRRYVIPLSDFRFRGPENRPLAMLHSLALQTASPAARGSTMEIASLGLTSQGPRLGAMTRGPSGVTLRIVGSKGQPATVRWLDGKAALVRRDVPAAGSVRIDDPAARKVWVCYGEANRAEACDPPDAPATRYLLPPAAGQPLVIDDFEAEASVNAHRQPVTIFASGYEVERRLSVTRSVGAMRLAPVLGKPEEYAGYMTDLPPVPPTMNSLELRLRGNVSPTRVTIGLRDAKGTEPRLALASYLRQLGPDWSVVRIPLGAVRAAYAGYGGKGAMGPPRRLAIALVGGGPAAAAGAPGPWLELGGIRFLAERAPLVLASFDGPRPRLNDVAGPISKEAASGATLELDLSRPGAEGKGLSVRVAGVGGPRYALVALGLGGLDARGLSTLSFRVRGATGGETADIVLQQGRAQRARLKLSSYATLSREWKPVRIPLRDFAAQNPKLDLSKLSELVLLWGDRELGQESLAFDDFILQ
jgi:hypothetical protein